MFQLVRNTLTNKEGFMIFILWNHLWVAGWIAYQMDVNFWKVTSAGLLATLIVSPLYFIRKDSYLIRYLVGIGLLYYSIAFDLYTVSGNLVSRVHRPGLFGSLSGLEADCIGGGDAGCGDINRILHRFLPVV